jgi:hypothetical protein
MKPKPDIRYPGTTTQKLPISFVPLRLPNGSVVNAHHHTFKSKAALLAFKDAYTAINTALSSFMATVVATLSASPNNALQAQWNFIYPILSNFFNTVLITDLNLTKYEPEPENNESYDTPTPAPQPFTQQSIQYGSPPKHTSPI